MKKQREFLMLILLAMVFTLAAVVMMIFINRRSKENVAPTIAGYIEEKSSSQVQIPSEEDNEVMENGVVPSYSAPEDEGDMLEFVYGYGMGEESIPRRFGYVVEENIKEREVPLQEDDFKQLRKGQYFFSGRDDTITPAGIVDVVGWFDGQLMHTPRNPGTGDAHTSPYYMIDDNTYVILFFEHNNRSYPLDHIEVWDADGDKLREIEIN